MHPGTARASRCGSGSFAERTESDRTTANLRPIRSRKVGSLDAARRSRMRSAADDVTSVVEAVRGRELRLRHPDHLRARVHILHEGGRRCPLPRSPRLRPRRSPSRAAVPCQQSTDGDAFAGPEPEGRPPTVVTPIEHGVGMDADRPVETPRLPLQHEQRGHQLGQAGDRPSQLRRLLEQNLSRAEIHEDRRRSLHLRNGHRVRRRRQVGNERRRRAVGRHGGRGWPAPAGPSAPSAENWLSRISRGSKATAPAAARRLTRWRGGRAGWCGAAPA